MKLAARLATLIAIALVAAPTATAAKPRAKVRILTGQVMATPYASGRQVVVPVLVDAASLRRAKLRAPVGVLLLKSAKKVKVRGQRARVAPALLRAGDSLRARARVTGAVRRAPYWRMPARAFKLTKRSTTLGPAELQAVLGGFSGDLRALETALTGLTTYVQAGFQKFGGDIGVLRGDLSLLATALQALEQRVAALEAGFPALEARMQTQLAALAQDFGSLQTQLTALEAQLGGLDGDMTALEDEIAQLQTSVGALCGPTSLLDALC